jgi:hypothetical protein
VAIVLCIDPGESTGVALIQSDATFHVPPTLLDTATIMFEEFTDTLSTFIQIHRPTHIVCEEFRIAPSASRVFIGDRLTPVRIMGQLEAIAAQSHPPLTVNYVRPLDRRFFDDIEKWAMVDLTSDIETSSPMRFYKTRHEKDAIATGLYWLYFKAPADGPASVRRDFGKEASRTRRLEDVSGGVGTKERSHAT